MKKLTCILLAAVFCAALFCTSLPVASVWGAEITESEDGGGAGKHETPPADESSEEPEISSVPEESSPVSSEETFESQPESSGEGTDTPSSDTESDPVSSGEDTSGESSFEETSSEDGVSSDENTSSEFEFSSEEELDPESETSVNQNASSGPPEGFTGEVTSGASEIESSMLPPSSEESSQASSEDTSHTDETVGAPSDLPSAPSSTTTTGKTENNNRFLLLFGLFLIITGFIGLIVFIVLQIRYNRRLKAQAAAEEVELMDAAMYGAGAAVYTETEPAADEDDYSEYAGAFVLSDAPLAANDFDAMSDEELDAKLKEYEEKAKNTRVNGTVKGGKHSPRH